MHRSKTAWSFDHHVGAAQERRRIIEAERLSGFQIDDHFHFGGLLNWQIGWLCATQTEKDVGPEVNGLSQPLKAPADMLGQKRP